MPKMSILDLKAMLAAEKADALAAISAARLAEERADAMDYYLGHMAKDMPAQDGRSRAVSTDVADTIEGLMPNLMDIFAGSDEVVRFEPVGPEDEAAAAQETDYVNHVFMQQNPGFMILYSFIKDALLSSQGSSGRCGSVSKSCLANDPCIPADCCAAGFIPCAGSSLLGREESRRAIWRGGRGILGTGEGHVRQGNREGEAMPQVGGRLPIVHQILAAGNRCGMNSCCRSMTRRPLYRIREVDGQDDEIADALADLHRLTFFGGAPLPRFDWGSWWLAYSGAIPVAFAGVVPSTHVRSAGYICRVGVLRPHCGRGLQLRLMRAMELRARRNGWSCMVSDTTQNIPSANNFIRAGYRLYQPRYPWAYPDTLYWRKLIGSVASPHGTHPKRL